MAVDKSPPKSQAYMNGGLSSHQLPAKAIAHPLFLAELRCPVLAIAAFPVGSPR